MTPELERRILAGVAEVAVEHLSWRDELQPEMSLVEDLELDSIQRLTLVVEIENRFRICLDPERDGEIRTVRDLVREIGRLGGS